MKNVSKNSFSPVLFIGIGATFGFYTLRETYLHESWVGGAGGYMNKTIRSFHHRNLANTADLAFEKANEAGKAMGIPMITEREKLDEEMRRLTRASAEEMAERVKVEAAEVVIRDERLAYDTVENLKNYPVGKFHWGKYEGKTYEEVNKFDRGYLDWMASSTTYTFASDEIRNTHLVRWLEDNAEVLIANDDYFGEVGVRFEGDATIVSTLPIDNGYGGSTLVKMIGSEGHRFFTFYSGYKWKPMPGDEVHFKATVKRHGDYKGVNETLLTRVAVS